MSKLALSTPILDPEGNVVDNGSATLGSSLKNALLSDINPDSPQSPITPEEKISRFELYLKLRAATDDTDWTAEEIAKLKRLSLVFGTWIAGSLRSLLEGK